MGRTLVRASVLTLAALIGLACLGPALAADGAGDSAKVDVNRASMEQLQSLPGVGPVLAGRILEYREKHGPFQRIEDLMNVRGIGEKSFLKLRDLVTVGEKNSRKG